MRAVLLAVQSLPWMVLAAADAAMHRAKRSAGEPVQVALSPEGA